MELADLDRSVMPALGRLLREPLLHFFVLGALLFAFYGFLHRNTPASDSEIVMTQGQLNSIIAQHEALWGRPPEPKELQGLVDDWVHDEVLYREGMALGLDKDDPIVRRRIEQKVEFIGDGKPPAAPTDAELQAWLDAHTETYRTEPLFSLRQVYFDRGRHAGTLDADVARARKALLAGDVVTGDASSLPASLDDVRGSEVTALFGSEFEGSLAKLPVGGWQGPVDSGLGVHLVQVTVRTPGRIPPLSDVRAAVERDVMQRREMAAREAFYKILRDRYTLRVDASTVSAAVPAE